LYIRKLNFNIFPVQHIIPDLNITEPLWSVLETREGSRFTPPTFLKQLGHALQEEWYRILPKNVKNFYESLPRRIMAVLKAKVVQHRINKELYTVSVVLPLFCPTPVCITINRLYIISIIVVNRSRDSSVHRVTKLQAGMTEELGFDPYRGKSILSSP
jgi:hypothetical protein